MALSQNLYAYVQNNPLNFVDPSGHIPESLLQDPSLYKQIEEDHNFTSTSRRFIREWMQSQWNTLSKSDTSTKVLEYIELALHHSYVNSCIGNFVTKQDYFNQFLMPSISALNVDEGLEEAPLRNLAYTDVYNHLDIIIASAFYDVGWPQYTKALKNRNMAYEYEQKYKSILADVGLSEGILDIVDIPIAAIMSYASGGEKMDILYEMVFAALEPNEPGPSDFFDQVFNIREKNAKKLGIAYEEWQMIQNSEFRFLVDADVKELFIGSIEDYQENIMAEEVNGVEEYVSANEREVYNAYRLYYAEMIKLMNINGQGNELRIKKQEIKERWNNHKYKGDGMNKKTSVSIAILLVFSTSFIGCNSKMKQLYDIVQNFESDYIVLSEYVIENKDRLQIIEYLNSESSLSALENLEEYTKQMTEIATTEDQKVLVSVVEENLRILRKLGDINTSDTEWSTLHSAVVLSCQNMKKK